MKEYSENYDQCQTINHVTILTKLGSEFIEVDEEISPLLERINRFQNLPLTSLSCQYSCTGWTRIDFTYTGFKYSWII